jgi:hypothetical protein
VEQYFKNEIDSGIKNTHTKFHDYLRYIPDIKNSGINLLADLAYIGFKNKSYCLFLLNDETQFSKIISGMPRELIGNISTVKDYKTVFSFRDSFYLAWNNNYLALFPKQENMEDINETFIKEILNSSESNFTHHPDYNAIKKEDALLWFYLKNADLKISPSSSLKGYLDYDEGFDIYATDHLGSVYGEKQFYSLPDSLDNFIYADSSNDFINTNLCKLVSFFLPSDSLNKHLLENNRKIFQVKGKKIIAMHTISYDYDENFTKVKIDKVIYDTIREACLNILTANDTIPLVLSNSDFSAFNFKSIPENVKLTFNINENLVNTLYPLKLKYKLRFVHQKKNNYNEYHLEGKSSNYAELLKLYN